MFLPRALHAVQIKIAPDAFFERRFVRMPWANFALGTMIRSSPGWRIRVERHPISSTTPSIPFSSLTTSPTETGRSARR